MKIPFNQQNVASPWRAPNLTILPFPIANQTAATQVATAVHPALQNNHPPGVGITHLPQGAQEKWYAVYTRSRFEKKLFKALEKAGLKVFLPLIKENRKWSDRIKSVIVPLLPSYVFVKLPKRNMHQVYNYPGFVRYVASEGKPCVINEAEIDLLKNIEAHGLRVETNIDHCRVGDLVKINQGPLLGWEGRVDRKQGNKIVFLLESMNQTLSVELNSSQVEVLEGVKD